MVWTMCILLLGAVLLFCGWAICRAAGAITEQEIQPPDSEPPIVPIRPEVHRTPWKDSVGTIVLSPEQQSELMRIYREEYVEQCIWPEMPLLAFFRDVEYHQRRDKPIEVEIQFASRFRVLVLAKEHGLDWLTYAVKRATQQEIVT